MEMDIYLIVEPELGPSSGFRLFKLLHGDFFDIDLLTNDLFQGLGDLSRSGDARDCFDVLS